MIEWSKMIQTEEGCYIEAKSADGWTLRVETCIPREETAFCNRRWSVSKSDRIFSSGYCLGTFKGMGLCTAVYNVYTTGYPVGDDLRPASEVVKARPASRDSRLFIVKDEDKPPLYLGCMNVDGLSSDK